MNIVRGDSSPATSTRGDRRPMVAVVDPLFSGQEIAREFGTRGWSSMAVLIHPTSVAAYQEMVDPDVFAAVADGGGDLDVLLGRLRAHGVQAVVPGSERGVELTDRLATELGLPGNGTEFSLGRRDKYEMMCCLQAASVPAPRTAVFTRSGDVVRWAHRQRVWPVVLKPLRSAGTDGVFFCRTAADVDRAVTEIVGRTNKLGELNEAVCAQELLTGDQYFINTVSMGGRHNICEIWRDRKRLLPGRSLVYDVEELVPYHGAAQSSLVAYTKAVLDALHISTGPAHVEVVLTPSGPRLVEIGARVQGKIALRAVRAALGHNHITRTVDAITEPARFAVSCDEPYRMRRNLGTVCLIAPFDGTVGDASLLSSDNIPSLAEIVGDVRTGRPVSRTVDFFTAPAVVFLLAQSRQEIIRDTERVRALERDGLYLPAVPSACG